MAGVRPDSGLPPGSALTYPLTARLLEACAKIVWATSARHAGRRPCMVLAGGL